MTRTKFLILCILISLATAACGLKGPLYLPADGEPVPDQQQEKKAKSDQEQ